MPRLSGIWSDIKVAGIRHWLVVVAVVIAGIGASEYLDRRYFALEARYKAYEALQSTGPRKTAARWVTLVTVGDDEFWKGKLARRLPVKRDYLACLVRALDAADPAVIAIDYTLRSPMPDGSQFESPAYVEETKQLIDAIEEVAPHRRIVLPVTFDEAKKGRDGTFPMDAAIYSFHRFASANVRLGYTNLTIDARQVPITWQVREWKGVLKQENPLTSFSLAVASTANPALAFPRTFDGQLRWVIGGHFMKKDEFPSISADEVLQKPVAVWQDRIRHRIAIIGSIAHADGFGRGRYIDAFPTPVGVIPGVVIHANYVEAWLDSRVLPILSDWCVHCLEALIALTASILFIRRTSSWRKGAYLGLVLALAVILSYLLLQLFGVFFDPYLPMVFVVLHTFGERIYQWREGYLADQAAGQLRSA